MVRWVKSKIEFGFMRDEIVPHRMETKHQHDRENSTMVIGLGHMVLVFAMLSGCLFLSALTLLCESLRWKTLQVGGLQYYLASKIESYRPLGSRRSSHLGSEVSGSDSLT